MECQAKSTWIKANRQADLSERTPTDIGICIYLLVKKHRHGSVGF